MAIRKQEPAFKPAPDAILCSPEAFDAAAKQVDEIAEGQGDSYVGGIKIVENPLLPDNLLVVMSGSEVLEVVKFKESK